MNTLNLGENEAILYISFWATGFYGIGGQALSMESGQYTDLFVVWIWVTWTRAPYLAHHPQYDWHELGLPT